MKPRGILMSPIDILRPIACSPLHIPEDIPPDLLYAIGVSNFLYRSLSSDNINRRSLTIYGFVTRYIPCSACSFRLYIKFWWWSNPVLWFMKEPYFLPSRHITTQSL